MDRYHQDLADRLRAIGTPEARNAANELCRHYPGRDAFLGSSAYCQYAHAEQSARKLLSRAASIAGGGK